MGINTSKTLDAVEIRDTNDHTGVAVYNGDFVIKTLIIENELDEQATLQCQGSAHEDFSHFFNIGSTFNVAANTDSFQTCDSYFPYWRIIAICNTAPTTGNLTVYVLGVN